MTFDQILDGIASASEHLDGAQQQVEDYLTVFPYEWVVPILAIIAVVIIFRIFK